GPAALSESLWNKELSVTRRSRAAVARSVRLQNRSPRRREIFPALAPPIVWEEHRSHTSAGRPYPFDPAQAILRRLEPNREGHWNWRKWARTAAGAGALQCG